MSFVSPRLRITPIQWNSSEPGSETRPDRRAEAARRPDVHAHPRLPRQVHSAARRAALHQPLQRRQEARGPDELVSTDYRCFMRWWMSFFDKSSHSYYFSNTERYTIYRRGNKVLHVNFWVEMIGSIWKHDGRPFFKIRLAFKIFFFVSRGTQILHKFACKMTPRLRISTRASRKCWWRSWVTVKVTTPTDILTTEQEAMQ